MTDLGQTHLITPEINISNQFAENAAMTNTSFTPAQREALRMMVDISPETHKHLFNDYCIGCGKLVWEDYYLSDCCGEPLDKLLTAPCPLTGGDEADDVWLAPLMRWLCDLHTPHGYFSSVRFIPQIGVNGFYCDADGFSSVMKDVDEYGATPTAALLLAARAAGVPEVVAIFDMEKENEK